MLRWMQIPMLGIVGFKLQTLCNHNKKLDYKLKGREEILSLFLL